MPPRNLKSLFASVALPAWFLCHNNPSERVVAVSYSDLLARTHATAAMQLNVKTILNLKERHSHFVYRDVRLTGAENPRIEVKV